MNYITALWVSELISDIVCVIDFVSKNVVEYDELYALIDLSKCFELEYNLLILVFSPLSAVVDEAKLLKIKKPLKTTSIMKMFIIFIY